MSSNITLLARYDAYHTNISLGQIFVSYFSNTPHTHTHCSNTQMQDRYSDRHIYIYINPTDVTLGVMRLRIPRLKLAEASSLRLTHRSLDIEHYTGPKKINPPDLADVLPSQTDIRLLSASLVQAQNKDAAYYSQLRTDNAVEWSGFNSLKDRAQVDAHRPKTLCVFGPLIDSPPAHPDTVLTTMAYIDRTTKGLGMTHVHITLDICRST